MKVREFESLFRKYLLADLPGFEQKGPLLFVRPAVHLLRAFYFDGSGFDGSGFDGRGMTTPSAPRDRPPIGRRCCNRARN